MDIPPPLEELNNQLQHGFFFRRLQRGQRLDGSFGNNQRLASVAELHNDAARCVLEPLRISDWIARFPVAEVAIWNLNAGAAVIVVAARRENIEPELIFVLDANAPILLCDHASVNPMFTKELEHVIEERHRIDFSMRYVDLADKIQIVRGVNGLHSRPKPHRALGIDVRIPKSKWAVGSADYLRYRMVAVLRLLVLRRGKLEVVTDIKKQEIQRICTNCQIVHRHFISLCGAFAVCASALLRNQHLLFHFFPDVPPQAILSSFFLALSKICSMMLVGITDKTYCIRYNVSYL